MNLKKGNIILRDLKESDIEKRLYWETEETEWQLWDAPWLYGNKTEEEKQKELIAYENALRNRLVELSKIQNDEKRYDFQICINDAQETYIGWCGSYYIDDTYTIHKDGTHCTIGICIVEPKHRHKGYATQALQAFIAYLRSHGETDIYVQTWSGNTRMIHLAEKLDFKEINRKKNLRTVKGKQYDGLTFILKLDEKI